MKTSRKAASSELRSRTASRTTRNRSRESRPRAQAHTRLVCSYEASSEPWHLSLHTSLSVPRVFTSPSTSPSPSASFVAAAVLSSFSLGRRRRSAARRVWVSCVFRLASPAAAVSSPVLPRASGLVRLVRRVVRRRPSFVWLRPLFPPILPPHVLKPTVARRVRLNSRPVRAQPAEDTDHFTHASHSAPLSQQAIEMQP